MKSIEVPPTVNSSARVVDDEVSFDLHLILPFLFFRRRPRPAKYRRNFSFSQHTSPSQGGFKVGWTKFTRLIHNLYSQVHARLIVDGILTEPFEYNSGVKQGCKLAPTLYGIYAAVLLLLAYENVGHQFSIKIRFRYNGDLFDLRRLKAKTKTFIDFIR